MNSILRFAQRFGGNQTLRFPKESSRLHILMPGRQVHDLHQAAQEREAPGFIPQAKAGHRQIATRARRILHVCPRDGTSIRESHVFSPTR